MSRAAVLAPGYGATASQPILRGLAERLGARGIASRAVTFSTHGRRPSAGYRAEIADLRAARDELREAHDQVALVGRSFGGRMCAFLAADEPPAALAILGHPIAPPGRPRPRDEAALAAIRCRTLVVQGERDELGPLAVLERLARANPLVELSVIAGAGHDLGAYESDAVDRAALWLDAVMR